MSTYKHEVEEFARDQFENAKNGSSEIRFARLKAASASLNSRDMLVEKFGDVTARALVDNPNFSEIDVGFGKSIWAVVLSVDLRRSSRREIEIGPKATYLTMHTYLPTMINLVGRFSGSVVGLRGDGLIAIFGETEYEDADLFEVDPKVSKNAARDSVNCGKAMIETITDIINPILLENEIRGNLSVGIGIDQSPLVVTKIGYLSANELTAYGQAVNKACKTCDKDNKVQVSGAVRDIYPKGKKGRIKFVAGGHDAIGWLVDFPTDYRVLQDKPINRPR